MPRPREWLKRARFRLHKTRASQDPKKPRRHSETTGNTMVTLKAPPPRVTRSPLSIPIWASPAGTPLPISHLLSSAGYPPPQIPLGWRPPNPPLRRSGPVQPPFLLGRAARVKALRFAEGALRAQRWSLFLKARCTIKCTFILATNNRTPAQPARALAYSTPTMQLGPCDM